MLLGWVDCGGEGGLEFFYFCCCVYGDLYLLWLDCLVVFDYNVVFGYCCSECGIFVLYIYYEVVCFGWYVGKVVFV